MGNRAPKKLIQDAKDLSMPLLSWGDGEAGSYRDDLDHHLAQLQRNSVHSFLAGFEFPAWRMF